MALRPSQREATAYHEAGHAVMVHVEGYAVLACTIDLADQGMAGGVMWNNPLAVHASELPDDHDRPAPVRSVARIHGARLVYTPADGGLARVPAERFAS